MFVLPRSSYWLGYFLRPVLATYFHGCTLYLVIINQYNSSIIPFQTFCFPTNTFLLSRLLSLIQLPDFSNPLIHQYLQSDFSNPLIHQYLQSTDINTFSVPSFLWYPHFPPFPPLNSTVHHYDHFLTQSYSPVTFLVFSWFIIVSWQNHKLGHPDHYLLYV